MPRRRIRSSSHLRVFVGALFFILAVCATKMPKTQGVAVGRLKFEGLIRKQDTESFCFVLAADHEVRALVLEAPYFSAVDLVQKYLPLIPVSALMRDPLRSDLWIRDLHTNVLIQHGNQDRLVPLSQGERLFALAPHPKRLITYPAGGHNDLPETHGSYRDLKEFIDERFSAH